MNEQIGNIMKKNTDYRDKNWRGFALTKSDFAKLSDYRARMNDSISWSTLSSRVLELQMRM